MRVGRNQVVAYRLRANHLEGRLPAGSLAQAAFAGLQDSAPRAALVALHARVEGVAPGDWADPSLVQIWHRAGTVFVIPAADRWVWALGAWPRDPEEGARLERLAAAARSFMDGRSEAGPRDVARAVPSVQHHHQVRAICRAAGLTSRWDARTTVVLEAPPVEGDLEDARLALARRFFRSLGPADAAGFQRWARVSRADATATVDALGPELVEVGVAGRPRGILRDDAEALHAASPVRSGRGLPLGLDPYLQADRDLIAPDPDRRAWAWVPPEEPSAATSSRPRFPSGVVLADGEIRAFYRRQQHTVTVVPFEPLSPRHRDAVEREAHSLPIPGCAGHMRVVWAAE